MKRNLIIALVVIIVALIVLSVLFGAHVIPMGIFGLVGLAAIGSWIYVMREVRTKKTDIFAEQKSIEKAEKLLKTLNILIKISGISFVIGLAGVIAYNTLYALNETEDAASFILGFFGLAIFVISTFSSLLIFHSERRKSVS
jgi:lantibiotic modifying enzyme